MPTVPDEQPERVVTATTLATRKTGIHGCSCGIFTTDAVSLAIHISKHPGHTKREHP